jgi:cytochrome P450
MIPTRRISPAPMRFYEEDMSGCPFATLLDFDSFVEGTPRDTIRHMRENNRILWEADGHATGGHWLLFQQADIDFVLRETELFTNNFGPLLEDIPDDLLPEQQQSLTFMDPPAHRKYRTLVEYAFRPSQLRAREAAMRDLARTIVDAVIDRGECEFVTEVAIQLPMRVMFTLLGVQPADFARVVDLTNTLTLADDPEFAENRAAGFIASMQLIDFGEALAADHRAHPRDSMTMDVLQAEIDGVKLTDREFGRFFNNLIVGGIETTRNMLAWAMVEFVDHPEQYRMIQADPALVPGAVEEILRYRNTVAYLRRTAKRDLELAGETIPKGGKVICVLGSPNRDPALFADPDVFDITRPPADTRRNYRTFGGGPHFCLGINQARMNLAVMLEEIASRMDNPRLLAPPRHARSLFMDGFKELRLGFDRRPPVQ